jgi:uncharacterized protein YyaL (SSP411 family)
MAEIWLNRLRGEKSPYLLQHASNPVDWYPWGEEAFQRARKEDKPVFLSIGYSTCHWCHVMARESFEDTEVARLMNEAFVSVKVDREERPDIDHVYMAVCQMMTGSGGWPLSIIMTPEGRPFFAATYIPRENRFGRVGMLEMVPRVTHLWRTQRPKALAVADEVAAALERTSAQAPAADLGLTRAGKPEGRLYTTMLDAAYVGLREAFDEEHGGFGAAPKFPSPHNLFFLLRYWKRTGRKDALAMVERTLQEMRGGGIYDHVGFGFHRYSTDDRWLVPHFEKMLYDQALIALAYTEAFQATGKAEYRRTAQEIIAYVLRDMTSEAGGFYAAEDADSEGEEGRFYIWTAREFRDAVGDADADLAGRAFRVSQTGNAAGHPAGLPDGANVLHTGRSLDEAAKQLGMERTELDRRLETVRDRLWARRAGRVRPQRDDKILADWNGLMIAALARAAQVFDRPKLTAAARRAADYVLKHLRLQDGRLVHSLRSDDAVAANLDDYTFMTWGLLELYETTFEVGYLKTALEFNRMVLEHFGDESGGFYFTSDDAEKLLVRQKQIYDGAIPSGNSVALLNLVRLARMTGDSDLEERADAHARWFYNAACKTPLGHTHFLAALDFVVGPSYEIVIVGEPGGEDTGTMLKAIGSLFLPGKVVLLVPPGEPAASELKAIAGFASEYKCLAGAATAYVCRNFVCEHPTDDPAKMLTMLER